MSNECRRGPPGWALACVKGRLIRRELAEGRVVFPCSPRGAPAAKYRGPDSETSPCSPRGSFLQGNLPSTCRHSRGILTVVPAEPLGPLPCGVLRACPAGFSISSGNPHAPHGILTACPVEAFRELRSVLHNVESESLRCLFDTPGIRHLRESGSLHRLDCQPGAPA